MLQTISHFQHNRKCTHVDPSWHEPVACQVDIYGQQLPGGSDHSKINFLENVLYDHNH